MKKRGQEYQGIDAMHAKCGVGQISKRELGRPQESRKGWCLWKRDSEREMLRKVDFR